MKIECQLTVGDDVICIDQSDDKYRMLRSLAAAIRGAIRAYDASRYASDTIDDDDTLEALVIDQLSNKVK